VSEPTAEEVGRVSLDANTKAGEDKQLAQNYYFSGLFNRETGLYSDESGRKLSRRRWIETYFTIVDKKGNLRPLVLNRAQRRLEAMILRAERAGIPVRIGILKARQLGFSTYIQAVMFETILRGKNKRGLICADTQDRSELFLRIANTARRKMPKTTAEDDFFDFKMSSKAKYQLAWAAPIDGLIEITSSEVDRPGMGGTRGFVHLSESAHFVEAELKYPSILASLPSEPWTYGFDESTANGDVGLFRDNWWAGWAEKDVPLRSRTFQWASEFFAWQQHEEYFYSKTYGGGQQPSAAMIAEIEATLDDEERWLLTQRYFERGVGWRNVGYDQLAWRRAKIADPEIHNDVNLFNQEYPSRPSVAFMSTGNRVFSPDILERYARRASEPVWSGALEEPAASSLDGASAQ